MIDHELNRSQLEQLETLKLLLGGKRFSRNSPAFKETIEWVKNFPQSLKMFERENIRRLVCESFSLTQEDLDAAIIDRVGPAQNQGNSNLEAQRLEKELNAILPARGFLRRYVDYTSHSEAPLVYHVFSALCGVGCMLNRRVWFNMGYYRLFPTLGIIILGPSGIKKTSAANICIDLLQQVGLVKVYSEKLTPEALIDAMTDNATGLVYAPEMTVFLNKQKYNEGLVQLITRFMDCPNIWKSETIGRGEKALKNVGISSLMCSTLDWFIRSTPEDAFGGGFIARNLLIVQQSSARCEPIPVPGDAALAGDLVSGFADIHTFEGEITLGKLAGKYYDDWYRGKLQEQIKRPEHDMLATYYNRKPDHVKRVAICLHIIECRTYEICFACFDRALRLVEWTEQFLPEMLKQMFKTQVGEAADVILRHIRNAGMLAHSDLVHKMTYRMNAAELKTHIQSLKEARLIVEQLNNVSHWYEMAKAPKEGK